MNEADDKRQALIGAGKDGATLVLVGVDGSCTSRRAAAYAIGLARRQGARLLIAHITTPPNDCAMAGYPAAAILDATADGDEQLRRELVEEARSAGVWMEFLSVRGQACRELQRLAEERRAEVLVVGASESRWHKVAGSLSGQLIRAKRLPVMVVP